MDFYEVLDQVVALPRTRGRVTSRALKLQFHLDDEHLETLKEELIEAQRVAADEDGKVLVWVGTHAEGERANRAKGEESLGARVQSREVKLEAVKGLGATHTVNATRGDAVAAVNALTNGRGVDVVIEALGRSETVVQAFMMTRDGGRVVVIGIAPGTTTAGIEITRLVRRGIQLMGSYGSRVRTDLPELLALAARGQVSVSQPITRRYRLEQVDEAYAALQRGEIIGRAIITI